MTDASPTLGRCLSAYEETLLERIHTSMPGRVVTYDPANRTAVVVPGLADADGNAMPTIFDVPVVWPGGNGFSLTVGLNANDRVLLLFSERSIEEWLAKGLATDPHDLRRHSITDALALPAVWFMKKGPSVTASPTDMCLGRDNGTLVIRILPSGKIMIGNEISGVDLLDILDRLLLGLTTATVTVLGQPLVFTDPTLLTTLIGDLATIMGA